MKIGMTISSVRQYLVDMVYFHVSQENIVESLWKNIHDLYERDIATVKKKKFMKMLVNLKMKEGIPVI